MELKQVKCPNCGANLKLDNPGIGKKINCEFCKSTFTYHPEDDDINYTKAESERAKNSAEEYDAKTRYEVFQQQKDFFANFTKRSKKMMFLPIIIFIVFAGIIGFAAYSSSKSFDATSFNNHYSNGRQIGTFIKDDLGDVISNNKENKKHLITVVYKDYSSSDPEIIKEISSEIEGFKYYYVSHEKGKNGYINKYIIEDE